MKKINLARKSIRQMVKGGIIVSMIGLFSISMTKEAKAEVYEYDNLNRVTKVIYDDQSYISYEYDAGGNIINQKYYREDEKPSEGEDTGGKPEDNTDSGNNSGNTNSDSGNIGQGQQGNTEPVMPEPIEPQSPAEKHKTGMKATNKNAVYLITSVKKRTVSFYKLSNNKKKSYTVSNTVKIDGVTYKVTKISAKAFKGKEKLRKVTIGTNINSIGKQAFYDCTKLKTIIIKTENLKSVGKNAFKGIYKKATIKVPKKKYTKYKRLLKNKGQKKTVTIKKR